MCSITGHFSQIVWKSTTHVGFGKATTADGHKEYLVGIYLPPANFKDEWIDNVPRPLNGQIYVPSWSDINNHPGDTAKPPVPTLESLAQRAIDSGPLPVSLLKRSPIHGLSEQNWLQNGNRLPTLAKCIKQESKVFELKRPFGLKCERVVQIREWFALSKSGDGKAETLELHTCYSASTKEQIEVSSVL
ncbi:unnamed protein product [Dicrocoelium dendriticum]|nr:unnamed protein product [Dicrocoelium dendriticum]